MIKDTLPSLEMSFLSTKWLLNIFPYSFSISTVDLHFLPSLFVFPPSQWDDSLMFKFANKHTWTFLPPTQILIFRYLFLHLKFFLLFFVSLIPAPGFRGFLRFSKYLTSCLFACMLASHTFGNDSIRMFCSLRVSWTREFFERIMMQIKEALLLCLRSSFRLFLFTLLKS